MHQCNTVCVCFCSLPSMALLSAEQSDSLWVGSNCWPTGQFQGSEYASRLNASFTDGQTNREDDEYNSAVHAFCISQSGLMLLSSCCQVVVKLYAGTRWKLSNYAVMIKHESRLCYCFSCFSPLMFSETYFSVLFRFSTRRFVTRPPCWKQTRQNQALPNLHYVIHHLELSLVQCVEICWSLAIG